MYVSNTDSQMAVEPRVVGNSRQELSEKDVAGEGALQR